VEPGTNVYCARFWYWNLQFEMNGFLQTRIERYVDACPGAVSGQRGHDATFKVACALVRAVTSPYKPRDQLSGLSLLDGEWSEDDGARRQQAREQRKNVKA